MFDGSSVLITGGTGSFGRRFAAMVLGEYDPERCIIFSRDELKQYQMQREASFAGDSRLRFFLGDVRDRQRLLRAFQGVDYVVHAAALKQVPACEYNPFEAVRTNVVGAQNIIDAALDRGVKRVIALSTDKACNPVNLYGATKLCSDKLFVAGNSYAGSSPTRFAVVRYGNVVGSRGSVIPRFLEQREGGRLTVTHPEMTRFWITLEQGTRFVLNSLCRMGGGEVFVPRIPSMKLVDLARAIGPDCELDIVGVRPGEKLHEVMISQADGRHTLDMGKFYVITPEFSWWTDNGKWTQEAGRRVEEGFRYRSDENELWMSTEELYGAIRSPTGLA